MIRRGDAGPENTVCSDMWQGMLDSDLDKWFELLRGCLELDSFLPYFPRCSFVAIIGKLKSEMAISKAREDREKLCILDMPSVVGRPNTEIPERSKGGSPADR